jgi:hypothetical protein
VVFPLTAEPETFAASMRVLPVVLATAALVSMLAAACSSLTSGDNDGASAGDALEARITEELHRFTSWLEEHGQKGYIGEVGWPGKTRDAAKWNALAQRWFEVADQAGLWVTAWATGEWWPDDYELAIYEDRGESAGVDSPNLQTNVLEEHLQLSDAERGINVAGGEFGSPVDEETHSFSNRNPGLHDRDYHYDSAETFEYLASKGIGVVRIPFRWERLQPQLGGELDSDELDRLREVVSRAATAGLEAILDMHNYGAYYLHDGNRGVRCPIGSEPCPIAHFADVWARISEAFKDDDGVIAYGLMNEPIGLSSSDDMSEADVWHAASQQALGAIREQGDDKMIMVSGYFWAGVQQWVRWNPEPWIDDPEERFLYEAHHYFDRDGSGRYEQSYAEEAAAAREAGLR